MDDLVQRLRDHAAHQIGDAFKTCREAADEIKRLRAQLAERDRDAERLDWAERRWPDGIHAEGCAANHGMTVHGLHPAWTVFNGDHKTIPCESLRAAIDAAMAPSVKEG